MMKNVTCFLGTSPSAPSREQRLEFAVSNRVAIAPQTPETTAERLSKRFALATPLRNNGLTLSALPCYAVEAVRDSPGTALNFFARMTLNRGYTKTSLCYPFRGRAFNDVYKFPFCASGLGLDEQIFQEDFMMKNGVCFFGLPHPPQRGVEFAVSRLAAPQTPETTAERLSKRFALATACHGGGVSK